jgi:hypothetical protein
VAGVASLDPRLPLFQLLPLLPAQPPPLRAVSCDVCASTHVEMGTRPPPAFAQATLDVVADPLGEAKAAAASASSSVASIGSRLRPTAALIEAATMDSTAQPSAADVAELLRTGKQGAAAGTQRPRALKKRSAGSICACTRSCTLAARDRASRVRVRVPVGLSVWLAGWAGWLAVCLPVCLSCVAWRDSSRRDGGGRARAHGAAVRAPGARGRGGQAQDAQPGDAARARGQRCGAASVASF